MSSLWVYAQASRVLPLPFPSESLCGGLSLVSTLGRLTFFPCHFFPLFSRSSLTHVLYEKQSGMSWVALWWCSHHFLVLVLVPVLVPVLVLVPGLPFATSPDSGVPEGFSLPALATMRVSKSSKVSLAGSTELMRAEVKVLHSAVLGSELSSVKARSLESMVNFMPAS